jgi:hypothetical protein
VIQKRKVSFVDRRGVYHCVEVQAATVFEAVCRASAIFKHSVMEDPTWAAEFVVAVLEKPNTYRVKTVNKTEALLYVERFCRGLCGGGDYVLLRKWTACGMSLATTVRGCRDSLR